MNIFRKSIPVVSFILISMFLCTACSSTRVLSSWKSKEVPPPPVGKILVAGIAENGMKQRLFEDAFCKALKKAGVDAVQSYTSISEEDSANKNKTRAAAKALGVPYLLVTHVVGNDKRQVFRPGTTYPAPHSYYYDYGRYYPMVYGYVHEPGYYTTHDYVQLESNLYDVNSEALIWSAATETVDPEDIQKVVDDLSTVLVKRMQADGIIPE